MARRRGNDGVLREPAQIELLASPARVELVDTLEALGGEATVAELAAQLGRPADGLYYHLRQLVAGGLLEERDSDAGRRYRMASRRPLALHYQPGATDNAQAVGRVAASVLRVAGRDFAQALADPASVADGPLRELWASRAKGWVGEAELVEINQLLGRLLALLHQPRSADRDRLLALSWVMAPVDPRPIRRGDGQDARAARGRPKTSARGRRRTARPHGPA